MVRILTVPRICPWSSIIRKSSDSTPQIFTRSAPTGITSIFTKIKTKQVERNPKNKGQIKLIVQKHF